MKRQAKSFITINPDRPRWACTACWPAVLELGFIRDVGAVCYIQDIISSRESKFQEPRYALVLMDGQGHSEDIVILDEKPIKEFNENAQWNSYRPVYVDLTLDKAVSIHNAFLKHASKLELKRPWGWMVSRWLAAKSAGVVSRWEEKFGTTVENYYRNFYAKKVKAFHKRQKEFDEQRNNQ